LLITNDRENKKKAIEEGIYAETGKSLFLLSDDNYWVVCYCGAVVYWFDHWEASVNVNESSL